MNQIKEIIYRPGADLPPDIIQTAEGKLMVSDFKEGKAGLYDLIYNFQWSQEPLKAKVPPEERVKENTDTLRWAELVYPSIRESMRQVTEINRMKTPTDVQARFNYQENLFKVYKAMQSDIRKGMIGRTVFFPPKNGGDLIRAYFGELGLIENQANVVDYELKRILLKDEQLMVGVIINSLPQAEFQTILVADDCAASIISLWASAHLAKECYPQASNFTGVVSAGTQRGLLLFDQALTEHFQFEKHLVLSGVRVFAMNDSYYLMRTKKEGFPENTQFVGDMGAWAEKLPDTYNQGAAWNRWR